MQNTAKSRTGSGQGERTDSMIAVSASKLSTADLNNLMRALEIDVVALTEILVPRGHRAEMGMIDAPAIHYNLKGSGRISINRGPNMQLMPHLLIIVPPNTPFSIEVDGGDGATRLINRDCWKRDEEGLLRVAVPNEKPEVVQICGFFRLVCFATCANRSSSNSNRRTRLMVSSARP
jgi:AraC family transcriptional activator of mtrCDE